MQNNQTQNQQKEGNNNDQSKDKQNREHKTIKKMKENKIRFLEKIKKVDELFNRLTIKQRKGSKITKL